MRRRSIPGPGRFAIVPLERSRTRMSVGGCQVQDLFASGSPPERVRRTTRSVTRSRESSLRAESGRKKWCNEKVSARERNIRCLHSVPVSPCRQPVVQRVLAVFSAGTARNLLCTVAYKDRWNFPVEDVMELFGVPARRDPQPGGTEGAEDVLNLGAWFQKGWTQAGSIGEKSAEFVSGMFDRFREADALGYDNDGDQTEN